MTLFQRLFSPRPDPREALRPLYQAIVDEARRPAWYTVCGIEDSVSGRFDMVSAMFSLVVIRMEQDPSLARDTALLTELYVQDMDAQLREFGVGDPVVGKHVGKLVGAAGGRISAYRSGLAGDDAALRDAARRNTTLREGANEAALAEGLRDLAARLGRTDTAALKAGQIAA